MSTVDRPERKILPPLIAGQMLDRATFHERYEVMPSNVRFELVGGVVYMPSPLGIEHGETERDLSYWLGHYQRFTKGVRGANGTTTLFDDFGEPQPDLQLRIREECGGQSRIEKGYVVGPPELVVEISKSTLKYDLGPKRSDYERAGVCEYLCVGLDRQEIYWFFLCNGRFEEFGVNERGIFCSKVFPGLWLDPNAFFTEDVEGLIATLDRGLATPEHAAFADQLMKCDRGE